MSFPSEMHVLSLVCKKLDLVEIPYMVTGSFASNFYTVPRMTRDVDLVVELDLVNQSKLFQALQEDFYVSQDAMHQAISHQSMFNAIHNNTVFKVDFIVRKNVEYRKTEFSRRVQKYLNDQQIWVVSPEDLIISKLFWAKDSFSKLQISDIRNLLESVKNIDISYLESWINRLDLHQIYQKMNEAEV